MAKIYRIEGYIIVPNDDDLDIEALIKEKTNGYPCFRYNNEYEEFEWDDELEINKIDSNYAEVDKLFFQLTYNRELKEIEKTKEPDTRKCREALLKYSLDLFRRLY